MAGRASVAVSYHLRPFARQGVSPYAGGGLSVVMTSSAQEYLVLLLGVESTPGSSRGWFIEAGVAGGVLVAGGFRLRWR